MPGSRLEGAVIPRGFLDPAYVAASAENGRAVRLPGSGGWLIERPIAGSPFRDAIAPYPFLFCSNWRSLRQDIADAGRGLVSIAAVTDPFADVDEATLRTCFKDLVRPYKEQLVIDLSQRPETFVSRHHRDCARKGLKMLTVEKCENPAAHLAEWLALYDTLVERNRITGAALVSPETVRGLIAAEGVHLFRARKGEHTAGINICMAQGEHVYFHLAAFSPEGYRHFASYALLWTVIEYFAAAGARLCNFGAGAGAFNQGEDGLVAYKRGWANATRMTWLCGTICDAEAYRYLAAGRQAVHSTYFPAYRDGEFA
jgi:hypothetical protein